MAHTSVPKVTLQNSAHFGMVPTSTTYADSTLYPKITTHIAEVVQTLRHLNSDLEDSGIEAFLEPTPITGTVKIHGTHADILIYGNDDVVFQSRNVVGLSITRDNQGFATDMSKKLTHLRRLRDIYVAQWTLLNPKLAIDPRKPVLIAGEWIGAKIQRGVAVAQLSKRFVIISISINGKWQRDQDYAEISLPSHDIYNISRAGIYYATLYPEDVHRTISEVERIAEDVAARCPFAQTFGVEGLGEGVVWKLANPKYNANSALWFKTKGGNFKPTYARPPKKTFGFDTIEENRKAAANVAAMWCSQRRLEQGWDVLSEMSIDQNLRGLDEYLTWVQHDILIEEKGYIIKYELDEATLKIEITKLAKPWYLARIKSSNI